MKTLCLLATGAFVLALASVASASQISGEYIETRTCDVYTGPCFANGEFGLAGKEALMAWKVDDGSWNGVSLKGLGVALVVESKGTIGYNPSFGAKYHPMKSVILVDGDANAEQKEALVAFVKDAAADLTQNVVRVDTAPIALTNDHLTGKGRLAVGSIAKIETRGVAKGDCVCTNESVFYPPLTEVENSQPAYSLKSSFEGAGFNATWSTAGSRSAFLATFRR